MLSQVWWGRPHLWFQSLGNGATLDLNAWLWSMDGLAHAMWPPMVCHAFVMLLAFASSPVIVLHLCLIEIWLQIFVVVCAEELWMCVQIYWASRGRLTALTWRPAALTTLSLSGMHTNSQVHTRVLLSLSLHSTFSAFYASRLMIDKTHNRCRICHLKSNFYMFCGIDRTPSNLHCHLLTSIYIQTFKGGSDRERLITIQWL